MKRAMLALALTLAGPVSAGHSAEPDLPQWKEADRERLDQLAPVFLGGDLFPGSGREAGESSPAAPQINDGGSRPAVADSDAMKSGNDVTSGSEKLPPAPLTMRAPEVPVTPIVAEPVGPRPVTQELLRQYFRDSPESFLIDPQGLLTEQKANDLRRFLEYHSEESEFDIYVCVLDTGQVLPRTVSLEAVHRDWFPDGDAVMVVYELGAPGKTTFEFGTAVRQAFPQNLIERVGETCIAEANVTMLPGDQLERLSIELSIRLYWIARLLERQTRGLAVTESDLANAAAAPASEAVFAPPAWNRYLVWIIGLFCAAIPAGLLAWGWWRDSLFYGRPMQFPNRDSSPRLGGSSSGGTFAAAPFGREKPAENA